MSSDLGWYPTGQHVLWGAVAGLVASLIIGMPMMAMGALENMVAALVGSNDPLVGWAIHLVAGAFFGALFGLFVSTRSVLRGAGYGLAYGVIVGVLFAWLAVFAILGLPITLASEAARNDLALHLLWGVILGGAYAVALRTDRRVSHEPPRARVA